MIMRTIREDIFASKQKILLNLDDLLKMIEWDEKNGIKVFRLSSEVFSHKSNPKVVGFRF
jgi:UV DNA damage repair endonuclease